MIKTVRYRIIGYDEKGIDPRMSIQTKKRFGSWKSYKQSYGDTRILSFFDSIDKCVEEVYRRQKEKKEHLKLIEYPMLLVKI
jgi:hypothetical protein